MAQIYRRTTYGKRTYIETRDAAVNPTKNLDFVVLQIQKGKLIASVRFSTLDAALAEHERRVDIIKELSRVMGISQLAKSTELSE